MGLPSEARPPLPQEPYVPLTDAQLASRAASKLYLRLNRSDMDKVTSLLGLHPGSVPVYLHLPQEKMTLLAPAVNWCDGSDACLKRLILHFGVDNVKLVKK